MANKVGSAPPPPVVAVAAAAGHATAHPSPSSVECCMCGDHGLARELFRCRSCHFRYQHKYCSNLYPKADSYRSCNWCLREDGTTATTAAAAVTTTAKTSAKHNLHHHSAATPSSTHHSPSSSHKDQHHDSHHQNPPSATADHTNHKPNNNSHSLSSSTSTADNNSTGSSVAGAATVKQLQRGGDYAAHLLAKPLKKLRPAMLERSASEVIVRVRAAEEMGAPTPRKLVGAGGGVRGKIRRYKLLEEVSS